MRVLIDGVDLGISGERVSVDRMVSGEHTVSIAATEAGEERLLYEQQVTVEPGESATVTARVPMVGPDERAALDALEREIARALLGGGDVSVVEEAAERARGIIEASAYPGGPLAEKYRRWIELAERVTDGESAARRDVGAVPDVLSRSPRWQDLTAAAGEQKTFAAVIAEQGRYLAPYRSIDVDGAFADWDGVPMLADDALGDTVGPSEGADIDAVYLAADETSVYVRYDIAGGRAPVERAPKYDLIAAHAEPTSVMVLSIEETHDGRFQGRVEEQRRTDRTRLAERYGGAVVRAGAGAIEARFSLDLIRQVLGVSPGGSTDRVLDRLIIERFETRTEDGMSDSIAAVNRMFLLY
jgi:hypothetical protein